MTSTERSLSPGSDMEKIREESDNEQTQEQNVDNNVDSKSQEEHETQEDNLELDNVVSTSVETNDDDTQGNDTMEDPSNDPDAGGQTEVTPQESEGEEGHDGPDMGSSQEQTDPPDVQDQPGQNDVEGQPGHDVQEDSGQPETTQGYPSEDEHDPESQQGEQEQQDSGQDEPEDADTDDDPTQNHGHEETAERNDAKTFEEEGTVDHSEDEGIDDIALQQDLDRITDKSTHNNTRMETTKCWLAKENEVLKKTHFKDYHRLTNLQSVISAGRTMLQDYEDSMGVSYEKLNQLRNTLTELSTTVDKKLTTEGLVSWIQGERAHIADADGIANEKETTAEAATAHAHAANVHKAILKAEERAAVLEEQAAQAISAASVARQEAAAAAKTAEAARRAAEEKRKADEEAERRVQEEMRRKQEEERKQKEEEERRRREDERVAGTPEEQERRRKEAERKDPKNWPQFVYSVESCDINIPVGCVLRALPGIMDRDGITVKTVDQRSCDVSLSDNEELVSHIIQIEKVGDFRISEALALAIPHCAPRNTPSREVVIKRRLSTGQWKIEETKEVHFEDIKEYKFVEVRLTSASATLAVVTRPRTESLTVTRRGGKVLSSVDTRVCFVFRPSTFKTPTIMKVEIQPVELTLVSDVKYRKPIQCESLLASSPIVQFSLPGNRLPKPIIVNTPVPPNPNKQRRPQTSVGERDKTGSKTTPASRPMSAIMGSHKEDEPEDALYLLTKPWGEDWTVMTGVELIQSKGKDIVAMELSKPINKYVILRTTTTATVREVESIAKCLDASIKERIVQILLRQRTEQPQVVTLQCVPIIKSERYQRKLTDDGYDHGPPPSDDLELHEGQKLTIRFRGNVKPSESSEGGPTEMEVVFNSQIATKLDFNVEINDKYAQKSLDSYRGFARVFAKELVPKEPEKDDGKPSSSQGKSQQELDFVEKEILLCDQLISLPKPEPEPPKPIVNRTPVKFKTEDILDNEYLKHISSAMGDEWRLVAQQLGVRRMRIQAIMRNNVTSENNAIIYEMLATWAKRIPRCMNKVDILCNALTVASRSDLVEDIRDKEYEFYLERRRSVRESLLKKASIKVAQSLPIITEWRRLGKGLGLTPDNLNNIDGDHPGIRDKVITCLTKWRETQEEPDVSSLLRVLRRCRWGRIASDIQISLGIQ